MKNINHPSCYIIGHNNILLEFVEILLARSFSIKGIISPSNHIQSWANTQKIKSFQSLYEVDWEKNSADYLFNTINNEFIPTHVLQSIRVMAINFHDAPLSHSAGSYATSRASGNGEQASGISWHIFDELTDGGDILKQVSFPILPDETALSANMKSMEKVISTFSDLVIVILENFYLRTSQSSPQPRNFTRGKKIVENGEPTPIAENLLISAGFVSQSPSTATLQRFQKLSEQSRTDESKWVEMLIRFKPTAPTFHATVVSIHALPLKLYAQCLYSSRNLNDLPLVLLTAWLIYLYRLDGQTQISVCVRPQEVNIPRQFRPLFSSYLPLTVNVDAHNSFAQLLERVRNKYAALMEYKPYLNDIWQRYPELSEIIPPEQHACRIHMDTEHDLSKQAANPLPETFLTLLGQLLFNVTRPTSDIF